MQIFLIIGILVLIVGIITFLWKTNRLTKKRLMAISAGLLIIGSGITILFDFPGPPVEWYVSTTGSDLTGDGTIGTPFFTLQKAINKSSNGDTVYLRGGTYNITGMTGDRGVIINRSGTSTANPYIIRNYTGEKVVLSGAKVRYFDAWYAMINIGQNTVCSNLTLYGLNFSNVDAEYCVRVHNTDLGDKHYIKFQHCDWYNNTNYSLAITNTKTTTVGFVENVELSNCTFTDITQWSGNPYEGVGWTGVKNSTIMYNTWRNCGKNNMALSNNTQYIHVHHNRFFNNHTITYLDDGSAMLGLDGGQEAAASNVSHITIFNNYFWGNNISAIAVDAGEDSGGDAEWINISNNVIHTMCWKDPGLSRTQHGIALLRVHSSCTMKNITIMYNTVHVHNGTSSPFFAENVYTSTIRNITIANNIFMTSRSSGTSYVMKLNHLAYFPTVYMKMVNNTVNRSQGGVTKAYWNGATGTYYGYYPVNASPDFLSAYNLHLNSTSPCINVGNTTYRVPYDYDSNTRPQSSRYDIGAYEYTSGGGSSYSATIRTNGVDYFIWYGANFTLSSVVANITGLNEATEYVAYWNHSGNWSYYYGDGTGNNHLVHTFDVIRTYMDDSAGTITFYMAVNPFITYSVYTAARSVPLTYITAGYNYTGYTLSASTTLSAISNKLVQTTGYTVSLWNKTTYTWNHWIHGFSITDTQVTQYAVILTKINATKTWVQ